jgi:hypothetical protein
MTLKFPSCENCTYSDDGESPADKSDGEWILCRRHAPVVFGEAKDGYSGGNGVFPRVAPIDWCGEWVQDCINTGQRDQDNYIARQRALFEEQQGEEHKLRVLREAGLLPAPGGATR